MNIKNILKITLVFIVLTCSIILFSTSKTENKPIDTPQNNIDTCKLYLKLCDDEVCLMENDKIIKKYEIDITLLPGDDILLLTNGIKISTEAEADLLAEDFDG